MGAMLAKDLRTKTLVEQLVENGVPFTEITLVDQDTGSQSHFLIETHRYAYVVHNRDEGWSEMVKPSSCFPTANNIAAQACWQRNPRRNEQC